MINWGFIGCGDVVEHKSGKPFWLDGQSTVRAVMCRNLNSAENFAKKYNVPEFFDDANKVINNKNIDAIYIATPPNTHMMYAKQAILAGKAVYVEKPMGLNFEECQEVLELANEKNVHLFVAYYRRALPYYQKIKEIIDNNEIGEIRSVNILHFTKKPENQELVWRRDSKIAGGGLFYDLGCHTLDILDYIISPIKEVYGFSDNKRKLFESDDTVSCSFKFENGVIGTGLWCFDVDEKLEKVQIIGNQGRIEFQVFGTKLCVIKNDTSEEFQFIHPEFIQEPLIHNVINALNSENKALSTGETAIRTTKIIDKITK